MTSDDLISKIDYFKNLLAQLNDGGNRIRDLWQLKKEIFESFKHVRFETRSDREEAWNEFIQLSNEFKEKHQALKNENESFAQEANGKLKEIDKLLEGSFFTSELRSEDFKEIRNKIFETFEFIKQPRWPSKEMKDEAWKKLNSLRSTVKEKEDNFYDRIRKEKTKVKKHSEELTNKVLNTLDACHPDGALENLIDVLAKLSSYAIGLGFLIDFFNLITGHKEKEENPLKVKSKTLGDIGRFISEHKNELTKEDKEKINTRYNEVKLDLQQAWDDYKEEKNRKKSEWREKQEAFLEKLVQRRSNQVEFKGKLEISLSKQRNSLGGMSDALERQLDFLQKQNNQLEELEEKYNEAYSDNYRDRVSEWIDKKKEFIDKIESDIESLKSKIDDVEENIPKLESRIEAIKEDIENLDSKIEEVRNKLRD